MNDHQCIDLEHLGLEGAIACYLVDGPEPAIVDPGPATTMERRTFGDLHDQLWGEVKPVDPSRIDVWRAGEPSSAAGLRPVSTPGHIAHHLAFLDEGDGTLFSGDSMGITLGDGPQHPPTPPPSVNLPDWYRTLDEIGEIAPERYAATHFGFHKDVEPRRIQLLDRLEKLEARVRSAVSEDREEEDAAAFEREVRTELAPLMGEERVNRYFDMFPAATDWAGVMFYIKRNP